MTYYHNIIDAEFEEITDQQPSCTHHHTACDDREYERFVDIATFLMFWVTIGMVGCRLGMQLIIHHTAYLW